MAIRPVSAIKPYDLIWSGDSALKLDPLPPEPVALPDEAPHEIAARHVAWAAACEATRKRNSEAYSRAHESGDWSPLLRDGDAPCRFRVRQVPGHAWRAFERVWDGLAPREWCLLVFRLGVVDILDGPIGTKIDLVEHLGRDGKPTGLGLVLPVEVCDALDRISPAIIDELSLLILQQRSLSSGK